MIICHSEMCDEPLASLARLDVPLHLTGSRYLDVAGPRSDWDFWTPSGDSSQASGYSYLPAGLDERLLKLGFTRDMNVRHGYLDDPQLHAMWRWSDGTLSIDVLVVDRKVWTARLAAMEALRERSRSEREEFCQRMRHPGKRGWASVFAMVDAAALDAAEGKATT